MMIALDQARAVLKERVAPLAPIEVALGHALGCVLTCSPFSDVDLPPHDVSAMDGYAVRSVDLGHGEPLPVVMEVSAGAQVHRLPLRSAARIFTGASVRFGADTVVPQEEAVVRSDGCVTLEHAPLGANVRRRGEAVGCGAELAPVGSRVTPAMIALLTACGASRVLVVPKPRISVVVTGAELVDASCAPGPGQVRDSNGPLLAALASATGFAAPSLRRTDDSAHALGAAISTALEVADLVLTTGGVSVGDYDLVPDVVRELGGEVVFHRVRVKPGKPILAATFGPKWLIGLPGNPLAVLAGWRLFVWPLAAALGGCQGAFNEAPVWGELVAPASTPMGRTELRPARLRWHSGRARVTVLDWKGSHDVRAAAAADALARLEPGTTYVEGAQVPCYVLPTGGVWPDGANRAE